MRDRQGKGGKGHMEINEMVTLTSEDGKKNGKNKMMKNKTSRHRHMHTHTHKQTHTHTDAHMPRAGLPTAYFSIHKHIHLWKHVT